MENETNSGDTAAIPQPHGGALKNFAPGVSGNPSGRPKGAKNRSTLYREWLDSDDSEAKVMRALIAKAATGDVAAIKEIMDGAYGKIADKVVEVPKDDVDLTDTVLANLSTEQLEAALNDRKYE